jgi:hypothetical protein
MPRFPKEEEITITLRIVTQTEEDREYFLSENNEVQPGFLADCFDMFDMISNHILAINGKTYTEYHRILQGNS